MNAQSLLMSAAYYMEDVSDPVSTLLWIGLAILVALILVVVMIVSLLASMVIPFLV